LPQISHNELTDLEAIGQGGFSVICRAKHARFGTVVYKKLHAEKLGERYLVTLSVLMRFYTDAFKICRNCDHRPPEYDADVSQFFLFIY